AAAHPDQPNPRDVSDGLHDIGLSRWKCCRDLTGALRDLQESLQGFQQIAAADRENLEAQRDVADGYAHIGLVLGEAGRRNEALQNNRRALAIYEELARRDPNSEQNAGNAASVRARITAL